MQRTIMFLAAAAALIMPAAAQTFPAPNESAFPLEPIPVEELRGFDQYLVDEKLGSLDQTLSDEQVTRRLGRLYQLQAKILQAQADGDAHSAERMLDLAMTEVGSMAEQPGIMEKPRYRELFRTIVIEHEHYFGPAGTRMRSVYGSVFAIRSDIFAMHDQVEDPLIEETVLPKVALATTLVPMTQNRIVEQTIKYFLERKRETLIRWMDRADTYFPMIERIFAEEGVPDELKYLALVESGLNPRARSNKAASGMWQFISATGMQYGLTSDTWYDERLDPEKATRAAARHLRDLYGIYGDNWHLALAGYNCSSRCIKRAISRAGGSIENPPSYWDIYNYLPRETRGFVPQFIAFALIMSNPGAFGLPTNSSGPAYAYDVVPVEGMLALKTVAEMVGSTEDVIEILNPELKRGHLPPRGTPYPLRIPLNTYARFADAFKELPAEAKRPLSEYTVKRGDSLGKIGNRFGVSVSALMSTNNLRRTTIHPGQHLIVPVASRSGSVKLADSGVQSVRWGARVIRPIGFEPGLAKVPSKPTIQKVSLTSPARAVTTASTSNSVIYHTVRRGDTLGELAQKHRTSISSIKSLNKLRGSTIRTGQRLKITPGQRANTGAIHVVRRGESLSRIANRYGTSVSRIKQVNSLRGSVIHPGQRLTIIVP